MICRDKIGNLHTSYEKMGDSYHLKAFFGINVSCAMNEVLKFPGLFKLEDLNEYLDSIVVIPKKKSIIYVEHTAYLSPKYLAEDYFIKPKLLSVSGASEGIFYFYFDDHFDIYEKKKFKIQVNVLDKSSTKALEAKNKIIEFNKIFSEISNQDQITQGLTDDALYTVELAESIQRKKNEAYISFLDTKQLTLDLINEISRNFKKEIKYIDDRLNTKSGIIGTEKITIDREFFNYSINKTLNENFWEEEVLKNSVRERLLKIAKEYVSGFDILKQIQIKEIIFHGSLANYHYDSYSDVDLQILFDFNEIQENSRDLRKFFNDKRKENKGKYKIFDHDIELQVHDITDLEKNRSSGIYSILNNDWIKKPKILDKIVNRQEVIERVNSFIKQYNILLEKGASQKDYEALLLNTRRERVEAFQREGDEYAVENEAFKVLRRSGIIEGLERRAENKYNLSAVSNITSFEKEIKKEISFDFLEEREGSLVIKRLPELPTTKFFNENSVQYTLKNKIKVKEIVSIPSFESSYSKKHLYEHEQSLKNKATNYNLDFVNKVDDKYDANTQDFIIDTTSEPIYILSGHNQDNVTAEIFVPIQDVRQNLLPNSSYLCKTEIVESENQYFILEI